MNRVLITLCFSLYTFVTSAQFKNILLHAATDTNHAPSNPTIVINPRNTKNIVVASSPDNLYYTMDGGLSWKKTTLTYSSGVMGNPVVAATGKGDFYLVHQSGDEGGKKPRHLVCHSSADGGQTWDEGSPIGQTLDKTLYDPGLATDLKGNLIVAFTQVDLANSSDPNCTSTILISTSGNGKKWSRPFQLSQTYGNCINDDFTARGASPAVTADGKIFVAWANQKKLFLDRSYDGGSMWITNDIAITEQKGGWNLSVPDHEGANGLPTLLTDNSKGIGRGSLYLVWADQRYGNNDADIWFMRSSNFGDNWTAALRVNKDETGKQQYLPAMTIDQTTGFLYIVYYDRSGYEDERTDVYLAYSVDNGLNFKNVKISETPFTPGGNELGQHIGIAAHKGVITPVWTRIDDGRTSIITSVIKHEDLVKAR